MQEMRQARKYVYVSVFPKSVAEKYVIVSLRYTTLVPADKLDVNSVQIVYMFKYAEDGQA